MVLPEPGQVNLAQVRTVIVPRIRELREAIAERGDVGEARELLRRIEAYQQYVDTQEAKAELAAEARRTEVLIGKLLGPGEVGSNQHSVTTEGSKLDKDQRHDFRRLAEDEEAVERLLNEGYTSRRSILSALSEPEPEDEAARETTKEVLAACRVICTRDPHLVATYIVNHLKPDVALTQLQMTFEAIAELERRIRGI